MASTLLGREGESQQGLGRCLPRARTHHGAEPESKERRAAVAEAARAVADVEAAKKAREEKLLLFLQQLQDEELRRREAAEAEQRALAARRQQQQQQEQEEQQGQQQQLLQEEEAREREAQQRRLQEEEEGKAQQRRHQEEEEGQARVDSFLAANGFAGLQARRRKHFRSCYPLHVAVQQNDPELVRLLLARQADPTQRDSSRRSPLELARQLNDPRSGSHGSVVSLLGGA